MASISTTAIPPTALLSTANLSWKRGWIPARRSIWAMWSCLSKTPRPTSRSRNLSVRARSRRWFCQTARWLCPRHPHEQATYRCTYCREVMCGSCVHIMRIKGGSRCFFAADLQPQVRADCRRRAAEKEKRLSRIARGHGQIEVPAPVRFGRGAKISAPGFKKRSPFFPAPQSMRGCSFMHGIRVNSLPFPAINCSQPRMPISSIVSRQSETNAGQMTSIRFFPSVARRGNS